MPWIHIHALLLTVLVVLDGNYGVSIANAKWHAALHTVAPAPPPSLSPSLLLAIGALVKDSKVNLERAALSSGRNSGHAVQGHVDATGTVVNKKLDGEALWVTIQVPKVRE